MHKLTEFYPEKQGRPESKVALDMEKRQPSIPADSITKIMLKGGDEFVLAEDLQTLISAFVEEMERLRIEMAQARLHLAKLSGENISVKDVS